MTKVRRQIVICVQNDGYAVSLERRKLYIALADAKAAEDGLVRVIDESGEDYLYPSTCFRTIELPLAVKRAVMAA